MSRPAARGASPGGGGGAAESGRAGEDALSSVGGGLRDEAEPTVHSL